MVMENENLLDNKIDKELDKENNLTSVSFFKYALKKGKPVIVSFSYNDLLSGKVLTLIKDTIEQGFSYTCFMGIHLMDDRYFMVGETFSFKYEDEDNSNNFIELYDEMYSKIDFFFTTKPSGSDLSEEDIDSFDISFRRIDNKFLTDLRIDDNYLSEQDKKIDVFKSFVERLYEFKRNAKSAAERYLYKLLLNSLLGRFGLDIYKTITKIVDLNQLKKIERLMYYSSKPKPKPLHDNRFLVSYIPKINKKLCKKLNLDLSKVRNYLDKNLLEDVEKGYPSVSVAISAAVTS